MSYQQAVQSAAQLAKKRQEWHWVVLSDSLWGTYDTASEYDLETYYLGSSPLVACGPMGEVESLA